MSAPASIDEQGFSASLVESQLGRGAVVPNLQELYTRGASSQAKERARLRIAPANA